MGVGWIWIGIWAQEIIGVYRKRDTGRSLGRRLSGIGIGGRESFSVEREKEMCGSSWIWRNNWVQERLERLRDFERSGLN